MNQTKYLNEPLRVTSSTHSVEASIHLKWSDCGNSITSIANVYVAWSWSFIVCRKVSPIQTIV